MIAVRCRRRAQRERREPAARSPGPIAQQRLLPDRRLPRRADTLRALALGAVPGIRVGHQAGHPSTAAPGTTTGRCPREVGPSPPPPPLRGSRSPRPAARPRPAPARSTSDSRSPAVSTTADVTVTETIQPGFTLQPVAGSNANVFPVGRHPAHRHRIHECDRRLHRCRQHRVPGELCRLQPRPDPPGDGAGRQAVGHQRTDSSPTPGCPPGSSPSSA